jgi:NADH dehydrogenase
MFFVLLLLSVVNGLRFSRYPIRNNGNIKMQYESDNPKIVIVGGGFGGLYTALGISKRIDSNVDVYLVDPKERFVFSPLLYELAVGSASAFEVSSKYSDLLRNTKVKFIKGFVKDIKFTDKICEISENGIYKEIKFDQVVISVGIQPRLDLIPGSKENSLPFYRLEDAIALKSKLKDFETSIKGFVRVSVVGGELKSQQISHKALAKTERLLLLLIAIKMF